MLGGDGPLTGRDQQRIWGAARSSSEKPVSPGQSLNHIGTIFNWVPDLKTVDSGGWWTCMGWEVSSKHLAGTRPPDNELAK